MPAKTKTRRVAQKSGARAIRRSARQRSARQGQQYAGEPAASTAVVADSLYSLRVKEKSGAEVFCAVEDVDYSRFDTLLQELTACWENAHYRITKEKLETGIPYNGVSMASQLTYVLRSFRSLIPKEYDINIDQDKNDGMHYFTIYRWAGMAAWWHHFEVGPVLLRLARENKALHNLFLSFLRALRLAGVFLWDEMMMGQTLEYTQHERIHELESEDPPHEYESARREIAEYKKGNAKKYVRQVFKAEKLTAEQLQKRAARFKGGNPIANLIYQGAEILKDGYNICGYSYMHHESLEDQCFLEIECQCNIVWSEDDILYKEHAMQLDAFGNEGAEESIYSLRIDADTKEIDFTKIEVAANWPRKFSQWFQRARDLIEQFQKKRKK